MARKNNSSRPSSFLLGLILAVILVVWYTRLEERQKAFIKNLLRQLPDLPGRYAA